MGKKEYTTDEYRLASEMPWRWGRKARFIIIAASVAWLAILAMALLVARAA